LLEKSAVLFKQWKSTVGQTGKKSFLFFQGFVDVYSEDKNAVNQHADRLLKVTEFYNPL